MKLEEQIRELSTIAGSVFKKVGLTNDTDIQELSREDLNELLPGLEHFILRMKISKIIKKFKEDQAKPIDKMLNELKEFLPADVLKSALIPGGVLHGYLPILIDLKEGLSRTLHFLEAHIKLLESYNQGKPTQAVPRGVTQSVDFTTESQTSYADENIQTRKDEGGNKSEFWGSNVFNKLIFGSGSKEITDGKIQDKKKGNQKSQIKPNDTNNEITVKVHSHVCGQTFNSHNALMKQVDELGVGLMREETSAEDCHVIMVFCPITSRVGTDIESAMKCVPGNREVILVLMHHTFDHDLVTSRRSASHYNNIVEEVNVLFHDLKGLLHCETNNKAVFVIHEALQRYKRQNQSTKSASQEF